MQPGREISISLTHQLLCSPWSGELFEPKMLNFRSGGSLGKTALPDGEERQVENRKNGLF